MANITLFAQIISQLPKEKIRKIIKKSGTDKHSKGYNTWSQFVSMIFSQFSGCDSVRDISNGLKSLLIIIKVRYIVFKRQPIL